MLGELSAAGVHSMAGMALMASLYGMFWDSEHNLVIINYVPGAGYVWFILWMLLVSGWQTSEHARRGHA